MVDDLALFRGQGAVAYGKVTQLFVREKRRRFSLGIPPAVLLRDGFYPRDVLVLHALAAIVGAADEFAVLVDLPDPHGELAFEIAVRLAALQRVDLRLEQRDLRIPLDHFESRVD